VPWVVLENVPFLRHLDKGRALELVVSAFEELGYAWCYRVIDAEAFGVPQRRKRWFFVASNIADPREVLLAGNGARPETGDTSDVAKGFYWTEGTRALGWAIDAVPPIKCGSSVGVASPPAIFMPSGRIVVPDIRDAERLQGFPADWTQPAEDIVKPGWRWRLVGNAVCVPVAEWLGRRLIEPQPYDATADMPLGSGWPAAAWGMNGVRHASAANETPIWLDRPHLVDFLSYPTKPLSPRAAQGFLSRARKGSLRFEEGFLATVEAHSEREAAIGGRS
jgi:DNA (cytosine-5)-methyltransferase 1